MPNRSLYGAILVLLISAVAVAQPNREANLKQLMGLGFKVAPSLPARPQSSLRPKAEIAARLHALRSYVLWVAAPSAEMAEPFKKSVFEGGQKQWLTATELAVFELDQEAAKAQYLNQIGWEMENMWALAWVLGFEKEPALSGQVQGDLARELVFKFAAKKDYTLRSLAEVQAQEDLFYCAHNAVRSGQMGKDTLPEGFHPTEDGGGIHERRHGLTWCLSPGVSWDDADLST